MLKIFSTVASYKIVFNSSHISCSPLCYMLEKLVCFFLEGVDIDDFFSSNRRIFQILGSWQDRHVCLALNFQNGMSSLNFHFPVILSCSAL